ncbi:hypothetical protein Taro_036804 [Colocasia esculenta]|uniref:Secreted protein n=1 Tax=Colocasia esculenta TaxID=4460 RepID=A0A843WMR3_COLES|nr:hypothetical protein [Colocasia esculenta]
MVAAVRPAATVLAVRVAAGVSVATVVSGGRVVGVDATSGNAAASEAAIMSRPRDRSRHGRDAPERRVRVATDENAATWSRQPVLSRESSQQRQGARRAEETGR